MAFIKFKPIASSFNFSLTIHGDDIDEEIKSYIDTNDEKIIMAFRAKRDLGIFTDKRIILVNKKGFVGFRKSIYAIEYSSIASYVLNINMFSSSIDVITNSGHELKIKFLKPISLEDVNVIYKYITDCVIEE